MQELKIKGLEGIQAEVSKADGLQCPRCWKYRGVVDNFDHLCDNCCEVMIEDHPNDDRTPKIKEMYEAQKLKWRTTLKKDA
jgi:hypothetical protein